MNNQDSVQLNLSKILSGFGLDEKEALVYKTLVGYKWKTALELSRKTNIARATLYRVLERMGKKGVIEVRVDDKTTYYQAASPESFESIVIEQEKEAADLRQNLGTLTTQVELLSSVGESETTVRFYRGIRGLKQMEWQGVEDGVKEVLIFGSAQWGGVLGEEFAEKIRGEMERKNIKVREVLNIGAIDSDELTADARGEVTWTKHRRYATQLFSYRLIDKKVFEITQDMTIINGEKIHLRGFRKGDLFGVELANSDLAKMQKQLFELVWRMGKEV